MNNRVLELAIEGLENRKAAIDEQIAELRSQIASSQPAQAKPVSAGQSGRSRTPALRSVRRQKTAVPPAKRGPQSAAAKKAASERMKAYWAKRRASQGKVEKKPARAKAKKKGKR